MPMLDKWMIAAQRPECIMAAMPYGGGIWNSPIRPGGPWPVPGSATTGSWAVKNGMLTYSNARTDRGVFEAATTGAWSVATRLDIRNSTSSYTFLASVWLSSDDIAGNAGLSVLYFGSPLSGNNATEGLHLSYWGKQKQLRAYISPHMIVKSDVDAAGLLDHWITVAMTIDLTAGNMTFWAGGILLGSRAATMTQLPDTTAAQKCIATSGSIFAGTHNASKVMSALIFDRALKPAEIQALS